ncbi:MAG TPA: protein kinase, partial [Pyrinomonadaceae bacterium]
MAYCYECGSEVAPDDIFCPYCGISLSPVNAGVSAIDEAVPDAPEPEASEIEKNETVDALAVRTEDYALSDTEENWNLPTASVDLPAKKSAHLDDLQTIEPVKGNNEIALHLATSNEENQELNSSTQAVSFDSPENDPKIADRNSVLENLPENAEENPAEIEDPFAATMPYVPLVHDNQERFAAKMAEAPRKSENAGSDAGNINENLPPMPREIAKPAEELKIPEAPPSLFDSVRIMEKKVSSPKPAENVFDSFAKSVPATAPPAANSSTDEKPKGVRSQTTPNIGATESGGKKGAKLKPLDEGTILNGRYEIIRKIGGGGMGAVYLASDNNLGGVLRAVKEMVQSYIEDSQQEKAINDFKRESMILSTLDHSAIPTIYDYFYDESESRFYLVMKYISGGDLAARLRAAPEGRIDEKTVTEWAIQIADVLDYLHNRPTTIVYRDLKPANVMVDGNSGRAMLIDFGIARSVNKEEKGVTAVGTMGYAPPELFSGNVEPRSDIYSLGSTMFHLLTGADPQSNPLLIFDFQKNPRPRQINPSLSDQMEKILMRAVEYNAHARFASAGEMRKTLEDHLEKLKTGRVSFGVRETPASVGLENQPVFCGFCGQRIMATDMFCAFCGSRQPLSQKGVHAEIYSPAAATARLMILGTNELDSPVFTLEKDENLVGRRDPQSNIFPEIDLSKFDPQTKISRRHARVWREGASFMVEDLGSSNGTVVIGAASETVKLLPRQPRALTSGDKIRLGDTTLHFVL